MPLTRGELIAKANKLVDEATEIIVSGDAEKKQHVQQMMDDAKSFQAQAIQLDELEKIAADIKASAIPALGGTSNPANLPDRKQFNSFGEFLSSVSTWYNGVDARLRKFVDNDEKAAEMKDMSGATGTGGGFLIPTEFQAQLRAVQSERSIVRPRATIIPMTRRQIQIPVLDQSGTTAGLPHWFGGLRAYWTEEAGLKTASDATFRQLVLTAYKLVMFTRASDELLDDSAISLSAFLNGEMGFSGAISWMEDYAFLQGSGVGQPLGILNSGALSSFNRATTSRITYPDLTGMFRRFMPTGKGVWLVSQSAMAELLELNGPTGNPSYLWGSAVNGAPSTLLGLPVVFTEKLPALGAKGDIMLADFSYYLVGDRQATTIESTKFEKWEYDQTSWRAVHRVDGRPWMNAPLTLQDGSTTISPFVALNAN